MRFEVPQFIEIEDKIFGPFTWKQFIYLIGGVGFGIVLFMVAPFFLFVLLGLPIAGLAILLAFYPVNNRPFAVFLESVVTYYNSRSIYYWRKKEQAVYKEQAAEASVSTPTPAATFTAPNVGKHGINSLSRQLELKAIQKQN